MQKAFKMKTDYWDIKITSADANRIEISITFLEKVIPENELQNLFNFFALLLESLGRKNKNPSRS